jgi:hypothetical protein
VSTKTVGINAVKIKHGKGKRMKRSGKARRRVRAPGTRPQLSEEERAQLQEVEQKAAKKKKKSIVIGSVVAAVLFVGLALVITALSSNKTTTTAAGGGEGPIDTPEQPPVVSVNTMVEGTATTKPPAKVAAQPGTLTDEQRAAINARMQQNAPPGRTVVKNQANPKGRFVRIVKEVNEALSLAEVQVFSGDINVAKGKAAKQSSTMGESSADRAVDGNTDGVHGNGSTTHTNNAASWWEVDLAATAALTKIVIWNRTDCCMERLNGYTVEVLDADRNVLWRKISQPIPRPSITFDLNRPNAAGETAAAPDVAVTVPLVTQEVTGKVPSRMDREYSQLLDMSGKVEFAIFARFWTTKPNSPILAKTKARGWIENSKAIAVENGRAVWIVESVGRIGGQSAVRVDDGRWHNVVIKYGDDLVPKLFVDGKKVGDKKLPRPKDPNNSIVKIGRARDQLGGQFEGQIAEIAYFRESWSISKSEEVSKSGAYDGKPAFRWRPEDALKDAPGKGETTAQVTQPATPKADTSPIIAVAQLVADRDYRKAITKAAAHPKLAALLDQSFKAKTPLLKTFQAQVGKQVAVPLKSGTETMTIRNVAPKGVTAVVRKGAANSPRFFTVDELTPEERVKRLGADNPSSFIYVALRELEAGKRKTAIEYFERSESPFGNAVARRLSQGTVSRQEENAKKALTLVLSKLGIEAEAEFVKAIDAGMRMDHDAAAVKAFVPLVDEYAKLYGKTTFGARFVEPLKTLSAWVSDAFQPGLAGEYFNNVKWEGDPVLQRVDSRVSFDWKGQSPGPGVAKNNFSVRWTGFLRPEKDGKYAFELSADDKLEVVFRGKKTGPSDKMVIPNQNLLGGKMYPVEIRYFEGNGAAKCNVLWSGAGIKKGPIDKKYLYHLPKE